MYCLERKSGAQMSNYSILCLVADIKLTIDPDRTPRIKFKSEDTNVGKATVRLRTTERQKRFRAYLVRDKVGVISFFSSLKGNYLNGTEI